jgi:PD-(D/E)XK endonuclease
MCSLPSPDRSASTHPVDVGQRTEAVIISELVRRGYRVLTPLGFNHRYDIVLDCGGRFIRVQCKTGRLRDGVILFATRSTRGNSRVVQSRTYTGDVDLFMVHCAETDQIYAVPIDEADITAGRLRVDATGNGQAKGIRWADDFVLPGDNQSRGGSARRKTPHGVS